MLFAGCSLCAALTALIVAYVYIVLPGERKSLALQAWVEHTHEVVASIDSVMASIDEAETGQRGFLLTGDASYLEPYERSVKQIWDQFSHLQNLTVDNLSQQGRLRVLHPRLQDKLSELAGTIDLARGGNLPAALDMVRTGQGKTLMDAVRTTITALDAEEERLLQLRLSDHERTQRAASDSVHALMIFGIVSTLIGGVAAITSLWIASARSAATAAERQRLLNMLDLAPVMMRGLDGTIRFWSEGCRRLFGWSAEQAVGRLAHELLQTEFQVPRDEINAHLMRERQWTGEFRSRSQDGAEVLVFAHKLLGESIDGRGVGVMETVTDITTLRKFEADLRASEARLNFFVENAPAGIAMFDTAMCYLAVSNRFLRDNGIADQTPAAMIGRSHYDVFPNFPDPRRALHGRVLSGESLSSEAEPLERVDGTVYWVRWEMHPWRNADGSVGGVLLSAEDMTERRTAETALHDNEARLRLVQKVGGIAYFDRILTGDVATISDEFSRMFNLPAGQTRLSLADALALVYPDDRDRIATATQRTIANNGKLEEEFRIPWHNGEPRRISMQTEVFPGDDGQPYRVVAALRDITEIANAREILAAQRDELERSNADLEEFTYAVSHDLKAPLRAIGNLAQWIGEDVTDTATQATIDNLRLLDGQVLRMQNLLDGLLEYSRVGQADKAIEDVSIAALVSDIIAMHALHASFEVTCEGEIQILRTHRVALQVVLENLISNAVKHHDLANGRIIIGTRLVDGLAEFRVSDDGPGIAERFHRRIFGIFQTLQTRDKREGSGLGLAIVKRKVESHGGRIWIESAPPVRGATFVFTWAATAP